jgi:CHAT domain-containing protein/tetratricopeptide (TPR) repeat protein
MRRRIAAIGLSCMLAPAAPAQQWIVDVPPRVSARGVDLRPGDAIDDPAGRLDAAALRRLEIERADRAPVPLRRIRAGGATSIALPVGAWDLETLPRAGSTELRGLLDARARRDWARALAALDAWIAAQSEPRLRAEGMLLRARWQALAGDWPAADATLEQAIALVPDAAADFIESHLRTLDRRSDRRAGLALAERLLQLRAGDAGPRRAHALLLRARARSLLRDNPGSLADADAALALAGDGLAAAQARLLRGFAALRGGDRARAAAEYDAARATIESLAPGSLEHGAILAQQATLAGITGAADTLPRFDGALAILRATAGDSPLLGSAAMNAHLMAMQRRRFDAAEAHARESLAAFAKGAPGTLFEQQARTALADVLLRRAQFDESEALFRQALAAADAIDPVGYEALSTRLQLGQVLLLQGRPADALPLFDAVLEATVAAAPGSPLRGTTLDADALGYRLHARVGLGRYADARADGERALARYAELNRAETIRAEVQLGIGEAAWREDLLDLARERADDAMARYASVGAGAIQLAAAHFLRARVRSAGGDIDGALADYGAAIDGLESHRAVVGGDDDIRARWAAQYQDYYKEPLLLLARRGDAAGAAGMEARYRAQLLRRLLASPDAAPAAWSTAGAANPADALAADQALVSYVSTRQALVLLAWRRGVGLPQVSVVPLRADELAAAVDRLRLLAAHGDPPPASVAAFDAQAQALYRDLFEPVLPSIDAARRWVVVPDGALRRLPFAALAIDPGPRPRRLVEARALATAASPAVFARAARRAEADPRVVAFGDVDPGLAPARDPLRHPDLAAPLPGARREVDGLLALHGARARGFLGAQATEAAVRANAPQATIVHFAVHGVLDPREPSRSFLALARGDGTPGDDGLLAADEIATLRLPGSLVVLSSCESALGGDAGGEGLLGMSRALGAAGATGVLGTLWRVPDAPTARLLLDFHARLRGGEPPDLALAQAQRAWLARSREAGLLESLRRAARLPDALPVAPASPFHWAGLVVEQGADPP